MANGYVQQGQETCTAADCDRPGMRIIALVTFLVLAPVAPAMAGATGACAATADAQLAACQAGANQALRHDRALCINESDAAARSECFAEAQSARTEELALCDRQHTARLNLCNALGPERYDPEFDPAGFDHDFSQLTNPNPYFPLGIGNRWEYANEAETVSIEVRNATKRIDGVTCIVVNDVVREDGRPVENTDDWFAQAHDGSIWYCGEQVKDYEFFPGDQPQRAELVSIDGSFKAGRDGDKPGMLLPAVPHVGMAYRIEWSPDNAEDAARVLSTSYGYGQDPELDRFVPESLARTFCAANNCLVIREFSPMEPGVNERKYYAPGIGRFLETNPAKGEAMPLVGCNFDPRCSSLAP